MVLVPLVVWPTQRPAISAAAFSQAKNQGSVIVLWGLLNKFFIRYAMFHHIPHVYILYLYKPSNVSGVWRITLYDN